MKITGGRYIAHNCIDGDVETAGRVRPDGEVDCVSRENKNHKRIEPALPLNER